MKDDSVGSFEPPVASDAVASDIVLPEDVVSSLPESQESPPLSPDDVVSQSPTIQGSPPLSPSSAQIEAQLEAEAGLESSVNALQSEKQKIDAAMQSMKEYEEYRAQMQAEHEPGSDDEPDSDENYQQTASGMTEGLAA